MAARKGISSLLSKVRPPTDAAPQPERKTTAFDKLMATNALDAEPNIGEIARRVSEFPPSRSPTIGQSKGQSNGPSKGQTSLSKGQSNGPSAGQSSGQSGGQSNGPSVSAPEELLHEGVVRFRPVEGPRTKSETSLWKFLSENRKIVISLADLSEETRVPEATLRKVLRRWAQQGLLTKTKAPGNAGMILCFAPHGQSTGQTTGQSSFPSKIDREDLNLSISLEVIQTTWPNLARCGFGVAQMQQITTNLAAVGKPTDRLLLGLGHIEYELAHGQLVAKDGQPVADPCSWAFRALAQNGYYRRPKGYVSPEEQALQDAEAEARALVQARQRVELAQFEAWKTGLTEAEVEKAMIGHPGGPKDAWLKSVWKKSTGKT